MEQQVGTKHEVPKPHQVVTKQQALRMLETYFGYTSFRPAQEAPIASLLRNEDVIGIMPTGAGKSICFQIPALCKAGLTIVFSPLISLMKDQVDGLLVQNIPAALINSTLTQSEFNKTMYEVRSGKIKLLYIAPERLSSNFFCNVLRALPIAQVIVDEAHCISEWGHDFRPSYRLIGEWLNSLPKRPIVGAFTATATKYVENDIKKLLGLDKANVYVTGFDRPNLSFSVIRTPKRMDYVVHYVRQHANENGIIYCATRKDVDRVYENLTRAGIKAGHYHGGLNDEVRREMQNAYADDKLQVMVATNAFGMGIDKPDVRFVIHYDIPKSLEGYYQETGRAGRDGEEGICIVFYSKKDLNKLEKFMEGKPVAEQDIGRQLLQETEAYAESSVCRRKMLLHYFGEDYPKCNCAMCDNCLHPKTKIEAQKQLLIILQAVKTLKENFRQEYVIDFVRGRATDDQKDHKHDELDDFGEGEDENPKIWNPVVRQALLAGYLKKDVENYGLLKLTAAGKRFLKSPESFMIVMDTEFKEEDEDDEPMMGTAVLDPELFSMLKNLRKKIAHKLEIPPYVIFQDVSLEQMAMMYPINEQELQNIQGVGAGKAKRYGKEFCELIKQHCEENNIERPEELRVRTVAKKSMQKVKIIQSIDRKLPLDDIATAEGLDFDDLLTKIEEIVYSGTKLNIDYFLEDVYDEDQIDDIYDYFMDSETDSLDAAMEELDSDYSEEEIRLVRIKFLSEMAN